MLLLLGRIQQLAKIMNRTALFKYIHSTAREPGWEYTDMD